MRANPALLSAAAICAAANADAQTTRHALARRQAEYHPVAPAKAHGIMKDFAQCVYRSRTGASWALLEHSDPGSIDMHGAGLDAGNLADRLSLTDCLTEDTRSPDPLSARFTRMLLRSLLEEEAYLAVNPVTPVQPDAGMPVPERRYVSDGNDLVQAKMLAGFADCVVARQTVAADHLLRTEPSSAEEKEAALAVASGVSACLTQGQSISFTPASVRAFVADGLWFRYASSRKPAGAR